MREKCSRKSCPEKMIWVTMVVCVAWIEGIYWRGYAAGRVVRSMVAVRWYWGWLVCCVNCGQFVAKCGHIGLAGAKCGQYFFALLKVALPGRRGVRTRRIRLPRVEVESERSVPDPGSPVQEK